jgi:hypothetical protein
MSCCRGYVRIHLYYLGCEGRMLIGIIVSYISDVLLLSLFQIASRLSDVRHVVCAACEYVNAAFVVLWGCVVRLGPY